MTTSLEIMTFLLAEFLSLHLCIFRLFDEYQSCCKFCNLGAHQILAYLDLCSYIYSQNTTMIPVEKQHNTERQKVNF